MTPARFLENRGPAWNRLEELLGRTRKGGVKALSGDEFHELMRLYSAAAADVAKCQMYDLPPAVKERVNRLAFAAHGLLYSQRPAQPVLAIWRFFSRDYPVLFRRLWPYIALSVVVFAPITLGAYATVLVKPATAYVLMPGLLDTPFSKGDVSERDISERFRHMPNAPMAAGIMSNNISVAFNAYALGITAGIGTCWVLLVNAVMLGVFVGHFVGHGLAYPLASYIVPHGMLEITAILIAAAAGLRMGLSLVMPGRLARSASLKAGAREALLLVLGTIPMFVLAGLIEGFVTPSYLPGSFKIVLGILAWLATLLWLLWAGFGAGRVSEPVR